MTDKTQISISSSFYRYLRAKIVSYVILTVILITGLFLKESKIEFAFIVPYLEIHIDNKILGFMPIIYLILPLLSLIPTVVDQCIKNIKFICKIKPKAAPVIFNKTDLNKLGYETIVPSIKSIIRAMGFLKIILLSFILLFIVAPFLGLISEKTDNGLYLVVIPIYLVVLLRYIKCYFLITNNSIAITSDTITFSVFGLFKTIKRDIIFSNIKDSVMYGARENVEMMLNQDIDQGVQDLIRSDSIFIQGMCIWDAKGKSYIFSNKLIPAEILSTMYKKLPGDKVQFISV